ncbi:MAG: CHRD domain-containing protein [Acidobacteria bacterium]|nr:CHRD domain-containing protein [Acidobacteriota bacterium]
MRLGLRSGIVGVAVLLLVAGPAMAELGYSAGLTGGQEVPPVATTATGTGFVVLDQVGSTITVLLAYSGLTTAATAGHIHRGAAGVNGPVVFNLAPPAVTTGAIVPVTFAVTPADIADLLAGNFYFNVHSSTFPGGEIRGQIGATLTYMTTLAGANEVPPVASPGTGTGVVVVHSATNEFAVTLSFSGLLATATAGHIHQAAVGVNGPVIFNLSPPAVTTGAITPQILQATAQQVTDLAGNLWYMNVHTGVFPGGEIRGQLTLFATPVELSSFDVD